MCVKKATKIMTPTIFSGQRTIRVNYSRDTILYAIRVWNTECDTFSSEHAKIIIREEIRIWDS